MKPPRSLAIVGGGTAGWMAACLLQAAWGDACTITLIEDPDTPTIGVGEGSTPLLKRFFSRLGLCESDWMPACDATYKAGILFDGWSASEPDYFHPFFSALDLNTGDAFFHQADRRRRGAAVDARPADYFVAAQVAELGLAAAPANALPFEVDYGYHFDAGKLSALLRRHACGRGVRYRPVKLAAVHTDDQRITGLALADGTECKADFYLDCTGFRSLLLQQGLGVGFHPYTDALLNDAAVVLQDSVPLPGLPARTRSTALTAGWAWQIPLQQRTGYGYVYSRRFCAPDQAAAELRAHAGVGADHPVRHLQFPVGRVHQHWQGNCLAVGLSQGFVEPLEATALMLVQSTIELFIQAREVASFNAHINRLFDGVRDYIVGHYLLAGRNEPYWQAARDTRCASEALRALLTRWDQGQDLHSLLAGPLGSVYMRPSWYVLLAGLGRFPRVQCADNSVGDSARHQCEQLARAHFSDHRRWLAAQR
ncbi:tryptophan halogenase family protein [Simiduia agarivorans]|uniref:NAD(FAD)-dependent dehydrogenase n=1 Tax=Simiduia agarivorans (strain DSM 21679 / JCM 13881 / BCRC 17597 / SA1) TaxID=1117647 RepID=K4KXS8_SIMAS|nr:tryptophan halogenase family protein [Simiduia agarivorans]AFU98717.1 NAD(FAD)-dependent dehydrogenase [Simiduia agarivorans SA1 = DSM 21679]